MDRQTSQVCAAAACIALRVTLLCCRPRTTSRWGTSSRWACRNPMLLPLATWLELSYKQIALVSEFKSRPRTTSTWACRRPMAASSSATWRRSRPRPPLFPVRSCGGCVGLPRACSCRCTMLEGVVCWVHGCGSQGAWPSRRAVPETPKSAGKGKGKVGEADAQMEADEEFARALQAKMDAETRAK